MSTNLCEDLIVEIFSRLPSKSVLRFRSVSKSLCARIGSSSFIKLHTLQSPKNVMMIHKLGLGHPETIICTVYSQRQFPNTSIPIEFPFRYTCIAGSCNGILCVYNGIDICLWNPSIRRQVTIPQLDKGGFRFLDLYVLGFGFDPISEDYKVLRLLYKRWNLYTVKTQTWREIAPPPASDAFNVVRDKLPSCLLNGALHWVVRAYRYVTREAVSDVGVYFYYYIMAFNLSSEVFSTIELPEPTWEINQVTIINGCLAVISSDDNGQSWIWVRAATSWSLAYKPVRNPFKTSLVVLQISPDDELLYDARSNGMLAYNLRTDELSRVMDFSDYCSSTSLVGMCMCGESLELLDTGVPCDTRY